jgi:hypothetical protein
MPCLRLLLANLTGMAKLNLCPEFPALAEVSMRL